MAIDIIPTGSSAVVSDDCARDVALMGAVKDAEADLERSGGLRYGDTVKTIKDAEGNLERSGGLHYGDTVKTIKDAEASLERSAGTRYGNTLETVKDAECNVREAVKDAECNLDRLAADRFADTTANIKDVEVTVEKANGFTRDVVRQSEIATEAAKAKVVDTVRKAEINAQREESHTRSLMGAAHADLKNSVFNTEKELGYSTLQGFKDQQMLSYQLAAAADRTACENAARAQYQFALADKDRAMHAADTALAFKEMELRQERLASIASKEAFVHSCELKDLIRVDGQKTRDLITHNEAERLRERAMRAESQLAAYFARNVAPVSP